MAEKEVENKVLACLKRIEEKLATLTKAKLAPIIQAELRHPKMARLYELTGQVACKELTRVLGCSQSTISDSWARWERLGLVIKDGRRYRKVLE